MAANFSKTISGTRTGRRHRAEGQRQRSAGEVAATPASRSSAWQRERAARLHRICGCIEGRIKRGQTLAKAVRWFAWYWSERFYKCDRARPIRFGAKSIVRLFYRWKDGGKSPSALALRYRSGRPSLNSADLARFLKVCLLPEVSSFHAAHAKLQAPAGRADAYRHAAGTGLRESLGAVFAGRRSVQASERRALRAIEAFNHQKGVKL